MSRTLSCPRLLLRSPLASTSTSPLVSFRALSLSGSRSAEPSAGESSLTPSMDPFVPAVASQPTNVFKKGSGRKNEIYHRKLLEPRKSSKDHISLRNLPHGLDNAALAKILTDNGVQVGYVRIMVYPRGDGRFVSRGYGFASLKHPEDERKGIQAALKLDGLDIEGQPLRVAIMQQRINGSLYSSARVFPPRPQPIPHLPVPGQWAYNRDQKLIAAGLPTPNYHAALNSPAHFAAINAPAYAHAEGEKKRKEKGAAGTRHRERFVPGAPRGGEGADEGGFGLRKMLDEIPVMTGVGGQRKWTARRRKGAEEDGWGIKPTFDE